MTSETQSIFKIKRIAIWAIVLLAAIGIIEGGFRIFEPYFSTFEYEYDPDMGFRVRPGAMGSNHFGFNDRDYPLDKPKDTLRVVFIGDSFSWSGGEKNYIQLLAKRLRKFRGKKVEIINTGYPCTQAQQQLALLKKYSIQYQPDLVILSFFNGNDFVDASPDMRLEVRNSSFIRVPNDESLLEKYFLHPIFIRFAFQKWARISAQFTSPQKDRIQIPSNTFMKLKANRMRFFRKMPPDEDPWRGHINFTLNKVRQMQKYLEERNLGFAIVSLPDELQVNSWMREAVLEHLNWKESDVDLDKPQKILESYAAKFSVPFFDLTPQLRVEAESDTLYFKNDTHLNLKGNRLVSRGLYPFLRKVLSTLPAEKTRTDTKEKFGQKRDYSYQFTQVSLE